MIVVTGGAGFIGSNLVKALNSRGREDLIVVDEFSGMDNLDGSRILDRLDKSEFRSRLNRGDAGLRTLEAVLHQGACTNTLERDEQFMIENNFRYSMDVLRHCIENRIPLIYASSASVYGTGTRFQEVPDAESPINVYGLSKKLFDDQVRGLLTAPPAQITGLRYFNVYGGGEGRKGPMASVIFHLNRQITNGGRLKLFRGSGGYADGEQRRDFVSVEDVVKVNLWFLDHPGRSGIFNVGTGQGRSFNEIAQTIIRWHGTGEIEYVDFPEGLADAYQSYTQADLGALRSAGYRDAFLPMEEGVRGYLAWLNPGPSSRPGT